MSGGGSAWRCRAAAAGLRFRWLPLLGGLQLFDLGSCPCLSFSLLDAAALPMHVQQRLPSNLAAPFF